MKKTLPVELTAIDLDRAVRNHSGKCLVAQAIRRAYPGVGRVMVDIQTIRFTDPDTGERLSWLTPFPIQDVIVALDAGELSKLDPLSFRLRRRDAHAIRRQVPATVEDVERRAAAPGKSKRGTKQVDVTPGTKHVRRAQTARAFGRRALPVNQARVRQGDLPPEPDEVPGS